MNETSPYPGPPLIPAEIRAAIAGIVSYNWDDEERDYLENCSDEPDDNQRSGHVFESLRLVRAWLGHHVPGVPRTGDRVSYQVMYPDGAGFGRAHIVHRTEYGRVTSFRNHPRRGTLARIAVENPQPGRARYVERAVTDIRTA